IDRNHHLQSCVSRRRLTAISRCGEVRSMANCLDAVLGGVVRIFARGNRRRRRGGAEADRFLRWDRLERREVLSAFTAVPYAAAPGGGHAEVREVPHAAERTLLRIEAIPSLVKVAAKRSPTFSVAQLKKMLPGKWRVTYDASSLFGPGARGAQEIT